MGKQYAVYDDDGFLLFTEMRQRDAIRIADGMGLGSYRVRAHEDEVPEMIEDIPPTPLVTVGYGDRCWYCDSPSHPSFQCTDAFAPEYDR